MLAIGLMSGTSLDGIDVVLCEVDGFGLATQIKCIDFDVYPIPNNIKTKIQKACLSAGFSTRELCSLNFEFGKVCSDAVKSIKEKHKLDDDAIAFVASHGQTIYHLPNPLDGEMASTLQIGEPAIIAFDHRVKVISNFRVMDMAAGGLGAPLVPHSERILYGKKDKHIVLQNIGGIGNLTSIKDNRVIAFDTGPGNMMIDQVVKYFYNQDYDKNGEIAKSGTCIETLFEELINHPFVKQQPPKTTGREEFGQQFVDEILQRYQSSEPRDIIHTFTKFTAYSIAYNYLNFLDELPDEVIIGGGGAYNATLLCFLKAMLPKTEIKTQEEIGYSSDAKEAIAFVILGNETLNHQTSNVTQATGAKLPVILGNITDNPFKYLKEK